MDLSGGYYDVGDNVKFGFPMAFTITLLAWSGIEYEGKITAVDELKNLKEAIKWGTDYFIKAHTEPEVFYVEVGDGISNHQCWQRPESMTTPRTSYRVDASHPGSDLVAETTAALSSSSIIFKESDSGYSNTLLTHARQLFDFGRNRRGVYSNSVSIVNGFYTSSGHEDELLWATAWLYCSTKENAYLDFIQKFNNFGGVRSQFSWDDKFVGAQVLMSKLILQGKVHSEGRLAELKKNGENFICNAIQKGSSNIKMTPGGLLWTQYANNLQYTAAASLAISVYADSIAAANGKLQCPGGSATSDDLIGFVRKQAD